MDNHKDTPQATRGGKMIGTRHLLKSALLAVVFTAGIDVQVPVMAQSVTVALNHEPSTLDLTSTRDSPSVRPTMENVVESLWGLDLNGDVMPTLATWTTSPDGKTVEFRLRRGVKFHSGDEMTSKDVIFSHQRSMEKAPQYARRGRLLEKIETPDDYTVRFVFKQFDASFLTARSLFVVSKAYFDRVGEKEFVDKPVGTGPYKFVSYTPGQSLQLEAFDGYWGDKPKVKRARFVISKEDTTRVSQLKAGEVDIIMNTAYAAVDELRKAGFKTVGVPVHPTLSVQFPFANPKVPWADVRVRRAIAHAIDGDAIVKGLFNNIPTRAPRLAPGELGYDPEIKNYAFDPALSKKLLAEAGYPNGFTLPLNYWTGTYQGAKETTEAAVLYLKAIGINAQVQALDSGQIMELVRKSRTDENANFVSIAHMPMANLDPIDVLSIAYSSGSAFSLYKNADFDRQFELAASEPDDAKRAAYVKAAIRILHDDVGTIPLWNTVAVYAMKKNVDYAPTKRTFPLMYLKNVSIN
jgi:peptide/nickel transport system substrate-binding protein